MQTDVESVARSLTKAQRETLLYDGFWWQRSGMVIGHPSALSALERKDLVTGKRNENPTPLGLAVRDYLKGNPNGN